MLFNIHTLNWDEEILKALDLPYSMLPEVQPYSSIYGETASDLLGAPIPIAGVAGDQQAALFGQTCFSPGITKNTYGTVYWKNQEDIMTNWSISRSFKPHMEEAVRLKLLSGWKKALSKASNCSAEEI